MQIRFWCRECASAYKYSVRNLHYDRRTTKRECIDLNSQMIIARGQRLFETQNKSDQHRKTTTTWKEK